MAHAPQAAACCDIELVNGSVIKGFLKPETPQEHVSDALRLDQSGQYLQIHPQTLTPEEIKARRDNEARTVFLPHAFFLLEHADRILSDSRMFLAPVPVQSGLAYSGTSGFNHPTLGVYIEWWLNCPESHYTDQNGNPTLVYYLAGSPLSGSNRCAMTDRQGNFIPVTFHQFMPLWRPFIHINTRYTEVKARCESYSLQEVIDLLKAEEL